MTTLQTLKVAFFTKTAKAPVRAKESDAGYDLYSDNEKDILIHPGSTELIPTGIAITIPEGTVGSIRPRSGLAAKHGITVLNSPGTIDAGYTGEVGVLLHNTSKETFVIKQHERIAQLVLEYIATPEIEITDELVSSDGHGSAGFGSTGTH